MSNSPPNDIPPISEKEREARGPDPAPSVDPGKVLANWLDALGAAKGRDPRCPLPKHGAWGELR